VGVCVVATGKYNAYAQEMIATAKSHFLPEHDVTYFVFTDRPLQEADDVVRIEQPRVGWPYDALKRSHIYIAHRSQLEHMDYLYSIDADMRFTAPVGNEIFGDLVGTRHFGFLNKSGPYEKSKSSAAYVSKKKGKVYFAAAFYGGKREEFFRLSEQLVAQIDRDLENDYIAIWHDESHLNRYFHDHPPTLLLSPSYVYPQDYGTDFPYERKIVAVTKLDECELKAQLAKD
jgi:histo-blood group ABO system transferase